MTRSQRVVTITWLSAAAAAATEHQRMLPDWRRTELTGIGSAGDEALTGGLDRMTTRDGLEAVAHAPGAG